MKITGLFSFPVKTSIVENCFNATGTHNEITGLVLTVPVIAALQYIYLHFVSLPAEKNRLKSATSQYCFQTLLIAEVYWSCSSRGVLCWNLFLLEFTNLWKNIYWL